MDTIVRIPAALRSLTAGADEVKAAGATVGAVIEDLEKRHPGLRDRLLDAKGVRRFINIYVGELHSFCTAASSLDVVVYHPDSDTGPTHHDHPMLNRTLIRGS